MVLLGARFAHNSLVHRATMQRILKLSPKSVNGFRVFKSDIRHHSLQIDRDAKHHAGHRGIENHATVRFFVYV